MNGALDWYTGDKLPTKNLRPAFFLPPDRILPGGQRTRHLASVRHPFNYATGQCFIPHLRTISISPVKSPQICNLCGGKWPSKAEAGTFLNAADNPYYKE